MNHINFDGNSGIQIRPEVAERWLKIEKDCPGNPSATHSTGRKAQAIIQEAKSEISSILNCSPQDVFFTSGATEANNWAIFSFAKQYKEKAHIYISQAEHPSCIAPVRELESQGHKVFWLPLNSYADIKTKVIEKTKAPSLFIGQWVNQETGWIQDLKAFSELNKQDNFFWHCDAVQGFGKIKQSEALWHADTFALSGHKIGAPKGIGLLRVKENFSMSPLILGGGQQTNLRSGTESPALISSFALALQLANAEQATFEQTTSQYRKILIKELNKAQLTFNIQTDLEPKKSTPHVINISFPNIDGRLLVPALNVQGVEVSSGSACASGASMASPVLLASGISKPLAESSLRISFQHKYKKEVFEAACRRIVRVISSIYKVAKS